MIHGILEQLCICGSSVILTENEDGLAWYVNRIYWSLRASLQDNSKIHLRNAMKVSSPFLQIHFSPEHFLPFHLPP